MIIARLYNSYQRFRPFTDEEAWMLFKLSAFSEAIGWTLLGGGVLSGNHIAVQLAGRIHGTFFLIYIAAALLLSPSLSWSLPRILIAGFCSVPPYGSLIYEQWSAHSRQQKSFNELRQVVGYNLLINH